MSTKRELDTQVILASAAELAEEKGLENVSLVQIAEKLGIKPPSLYNHVNGMQELTEGIAKLAVGRLEKVVRNAAVGLSKDDALTAVALAYRRFAKETLNCIRPFCGFLTVIRKTYRKRGAPLSTFCTG